MREGRDWRRGAGVPAGGEGAGELGAGKRRGVGGVVAAHVGVGVKGCPFAAGRRSDPLLLPAAKGTSLVLIRGPRRSGAGH